MQALLFSLSTTSPIILMLLLGHCLYRYKLIDEAFVQQGSTLVFKICLPTLLFLKMGQSDFSQLHKSLDIVLLNSGVVVLFTLLLWFLTARLQPAQRGVFVQGAFRSNTIIIGLALIQNSYGESADELSFLYIAIITVLANIMAILLLSGINKSILRSLSSNPLIWGTCLGLLYNYSHGQFWPWLAKSSSYAASLSLPLALICIGASLRLKRFQKKLILLVCLLKLIILPAIGILLTIQLLGKTSPMALGVVFLMLSSPTATASFVMAKQMHGDAALAANIVAATTVISIFTSTLGLLLLRLYQLI